MTNNQNAITAPRPRSAEPVTGSSVEGVIELMVDVVAGLVVVVDVVAGLVVVVVVVVVVDVDCGAVGVTDDETISVEPSA